MDALEHIDSQGERNVILQPYKGAKFPDAMRLPQGMMGWESCYVGLMARMHGSLVNGCFIKFQASGWPREILQTRSTIGRSFLHLKGPLLGMGGLAADSWIIRCPVLSFSRNVWTPPLGILGLHRSLFGTRSAGIGISLPSQIMKKRIKETRSLLIFFRLLGNSSCHCTVQQCLGGLHQEDVRRGIGTYLQCHCLGELTFPKASPAKR